MNSEQITVYRPNVRHESGFFQTWILMMRNVWGARELIWQLFKRDFFAAYKKSFVGIAWIFLAPLMGIVSWIFLQRTGMLHPGDVGVPYPVYVLVGTAMWGLFMNLYSAASGTLTSGGDLIMQVKYPHEALLFKQTAHQLANFLITLGLIFVVLLLFHVVPKWQTILLPLVALPLFFLAVAVGLMISMISIVAVDVSRFVDVVLAFLMYLTPIIYSDTIGNRTVSVVTRYNPLTYLVCSCRDLIIYGHLHDARGYWISAAGSFVLFMVSWRLFYVSETKIIERMI